MSLDRMIDSAVRCVKCGSGFGKCSCWIKLRCPKCKRELSVERDATDYQEAVRVEVTCDRCDDGDFSEVMQYDAMGRHITRDPESQSDAGVES